NVPFTGSPFLISMSCGMSMALSPRSRCCPEAILQKMADFPTVSGGLTLPHRPLGEAPAGAALSVRNGCGSMPGRHAMDDSTLARPARDASRTVTPRLVRATKETLQGYGTL